MLSRNSLIWVGSRVHFFSLIADFCNIHCMISVCSFPGRPWTRERNGILLLLHHLATSSLASTINSSMSLWASFLSRFLICRGTFSLDSDRFLLSKSKEISVDSKVIFPSFLRRFSRIKYNEKANWIVLSSSRNPSWLRLCFQSFNRL